MIYVITKGIYSDYHICAVATTIARAEELQKMYSDCWDEAIIEKYEPDVPNYPYYNNNPTLYWKIIFTKNGRIETVHSYYGESNLKLEIKESTFNPIFTLTIKNIRIDSKEKAIKIACDVRAKYLAEQLGL